jgi:hypothetical protein
MFQRHKEQAGAHEHNIEFLSTSVADDFLPYKNYQHNSLAFYRSILSALTIQDFRH